MIKPIMSISNSGLNYSGNRPNYTSGTQHKAKGKKNAGNDIKRPKSQLSFGQILSKTI